MPNKTLEGYQSRVAARTSEVSRLSSGIMVVSAPLDMILTLPSGQRTTTDILLRTLIQAHSQDVLTTTEKTARKSRRHGTRWNKGHRAERPATQGYEK